MLKEIRRIKERSKANYIRDLQYKGKIQTYLSDKGYVSYDPEELALWKKTCKKGRPTKNRGEPV